MDEHYKLEASIRAKVGETLTFVRARGASRKLFNPSLLAPCPLRMKISIFEFWIWKNEG